jgi:hypothetical protein
MPARSGKSHVSAARFASRGRLLHRITDGTIFTLNGYSGANERVIA